jgi:hypothetical protein
VFEYLFLEADYDGRIMSIDGITAVNKTHVNTLVTNRWQVLTTHYDQGVDTWRIVMQRIQIEQVEASV